MTTEPRLALTPAQTVGPFFNIGFLPLTALVAPDTPGAISITGQVLDGAGAPLGDALVEIWQADADGVYHHPEDPRWARDADGFGFGRALTDAEGRFRFDTIKPGVVPGPAGATQAPHVAVSVLARGLLHRLATRCYFVDEADANDSDPVLGSIADVGARASLLATPAAPGDYRFDIRLQGPAATAFFAI